MATKSSLLEVLLSSCKGWWPLGERAEIGARVGRRKRAKQPHLRSFACRSTYMAHNLPQLKEFTAPHRILHRVGRNFPVPKKVRLKAGT